MKSLLAKAALFTMFVLLTAAAASTGEGVPAAVHYIPHDKVAAVMAKGGPIISDPGLLVLANRREAGGVEYHEHTNHIFIMVDGEATFITGGTLVGAKRTSPDQMTGTSIEGGENFHLRKRALAVGVAILAVSSVCAWGQASYPPPNDLPNPYRTVTGWAQLPDGRKWG